MKKHCLSCQGLVPIRSSGYLILYTHVIEYYSSIIDILKISSLHFFQKKSGLKVKFESAEIIATLLTKIYKLFGEDNHQKILCYLLFGEEEEEAFLPFVSIKELSARLNNQKYMEIVQRSLFTSHMQPIINFENNSIIGYEFLLRKVDDRFSFFPNELFQFAQDAGLHAFLDNKARTSAIKVSSKLLDNGLKRFINFLPSSIYNPSYCLNTTFKNIEKYNVSPSDLVFEVVETEKIIDIELLKTVFEAYRNEGIEVALDDFGSGYSTLEVLKKLVPNYAKIDRSFIQNCDHDKAKQKFLKEILKIGRDMNIKILAEGIETKEEFDYCKHIGIQLGQGYFLGKPSATPIVQPLHNII